MEKWHAYYSVSASAAATLTGLIFVGASINLQKILSFRHLPGRALGTLILLINILLVSSFCLIPDQSLSDTGMEILILGIIIWGFNTRLDILTLADRTTHYRLQNLQNLICTQAAIFPYIVGSIYLLNADPRGFYWLIPGISMSFIKSLIDAWVLLIEIHR